MKLLCRVAFAAAVFVGVMLALFVVVVSIGIRVDLGTLRAPLRAAATAVLDREVRIDGSLTLVPTWSPTLEMQGLQIANPAGWSSPVFARMELARITVDVWPLLWRKAVVHELTAQGVEVNLERAADGRMNWLLDVSGPVPAAADGTAETAPRERRWSWIRELAIEELRLVDVVIELRDAVDDQHSRFELTDLAGALGTHDPLHLDARGRLGPEPYQLVIEGGPPIQIVTSDAPWPLTLRFDLAETRLVIETALDEAVPLPDSAEAAEKSGPEAPGRRRGALSVTLTGDRLESLERLAAVDLPPWGPYEIAATAEAFTGDRFATDLQIRVGTSSLSGNGDLALGTPPRIELKLTAPTIQLDDFTTEGWALVQKPGEPETTGEDANAEPVEEVAEAPPALLSADTLKRLNARLAIAVDNVASGADRLGAGRIVLALEDGVLAVETLDIEVPGGGAHLEMTLEPTPERVTASIRARVKRFDYGILARRLDPETAMGGLIGLDVDVDTWAPVGAPLMTHANGRFDFAAFPEKMDSGLIDLWAVNLLSAITPAVDSSENSQLNCVVVLFDAADGVMRDHTLMLDTSKMTVGGKAAIDFRERSIDITLEPKAKRPEFFSAATPVNVNGSFEDFGIGIDKGSVVFTVVKMATSIAHVPVRRIFRNESRTDDLDECLAALAGRETDRPATN